jgi:4-diphosphocytidyl-2-C-methyl-D-erythritol kinase
MDPLRVSVPAFAKLNLSLLVLDRRPDGFHELRTLFQTIALHDTLDLEFAPARRRSIRLQANMHIPGENLVTRAAQLVFDELRLRAHLHVRLTKRIPMGGGLGGGSSNAAAILLALPLLAGCPIPPARLAQLAAQLGSDVPFFLTAGAALGFGRGEELYALPDAQPRPVLLACPGTPAPTPQAFADLNRPLASALTSFRHHHRMKRFQSLVEAFLCPRSASDWLGLCENDFEAAVFRRLPQLETLFSQLSSHSRLARMSGSGSTLFGVFISERSRDRAASLLSQSNPDVTWIPTSFLSRQLFRRRWRRALAVARARLSPPAEDFGWIG